MSFSAPKPPDPNQTAMVQQQYNTQAAKEQNKNNSYNQATPFGSLNYVADSSSPSGYRIETNLSAPQQGLLDTRTNTQAIAGNTGQNLLQNSAGMYSTPFDLNSASGAVASRLNDWNSRYLQPIFNQQSSNLEAQLRQQGLAPGSQAYDNAKNLLARNQGDVTTDYLTKNQGQAFNQALTEYQTPLQTASGLFGMAAPTGPTFQSAPTAQMQPANYQGAVQANYDAQMKNYENTWNNIGKLGTAGIGLAAAPFTGGTSLLGTAGMFGKGLTGGWG